MELLNIYRCFSDETRLRILHLLAQGPCCVCHLQEILGAPQTAISKHLSYLKGHRLVVGKRREQWIIYQLPAERPVELDLQLRSLQETVKGNPVFREDLANYKRLHQQSPWIYESNGSDRGKR